MTVRTLDVSHLPTTGFGPRMTLWWGMIVFIAIESTVFAMLIVSYLYLWVLSPGWPPPPTPPPGLLYPTLNTAVLLLSVPIAYYTDRAAQREEDGPTLRLLVVMILLGFASLAFRVLEFRRLGVRWDDNAYGSVVWTLLAVHATHVLAETVENVLLGVVFWGGRRERKHFVDVHANMVYWYFVVAGWLVVYGLVALLPRLG
jgi:cytochrome c oxidase subunit I+III